MTRKELAALLVGIPDDAEIVIWGRDGSAYAAEPKWSMFDGETSFGLVRELDAEYVLDEEPLCRVRYEPR